MTAQTHVPPTALDRAEPGDRPASSPPTRWALAGLGAGIAGVGVVVSSGLVHAAYDEKLSGNAPGIVEELGNEVPQMLAFHLFAIVGSVLLVVFAAGLHRRLRAAAGPDSVLPLVAFTGALVTAMMMFVGAGLDTEFIFAVNDPDILVPETAVMFNHWIGTIPWCWGMLGLSGIALFGAARQGGLPRWMGLVGLLGGGLTLLLGISPLQYMAGMTGPLGLIVIALGFLAGDKAHRGRA
ncbi:hypothetical protein ACIRN4_27455 [Pimelobacter simplex]|uniref:DUF4386 family protein n=1 Tax=Nocardioides simplex TaxID=2045 RepID=A0A7J5E1L5_NOCSI|nr:hypothetical protein [Pimelobacter simplex]KAB2812057.1 hypothetical protein F9L07_09530 [Pimelobacter simplex]